MNKVILSGNLTRDPEVRYTQGGKAYARVGIAINRPFSKDKEVDFFNLVAWEKRAETMGKYLNKGSRIFVEGRLQTSSYEKDGVKHNGIDIIVENVEFADSKRPDNRDNRNTRKDDYRYDEEDAPDTPF